MSLGNFWTLVWLSYKALFIQRLGPDYYISVLARPALWVFMFTLVGRFTNNAELAKIFFVGMAVYGIHMAINIQVLQSISNERWSGTLSVIFLSSVDRLQAYVGRAGLHWLSGIMSFSVNLLWGWIFLGLDLAQSDWLSLLLSVVITTVSVTGFALFVGNMIFIIRNWMYISSVVNASLLLLTGIVIPRSDLPPILSEIGVILPFTHGVMAIRESLIVGSTAASFQYLLIELMIGLAYLAVGFALFRFVEERAKQKGDLEMGSL